MFCQLFTIYGLMMFVVFSEKKQMRHPQQFLDCP